MAQRGQYLEEAQQFAAFAAEQRENLGLAQRLIGRVINDNDGQASESLTKLYRILVEVEAAAVRVGVASVSALTTEMLAVLDRVRDHRLGLSQEVSALLTDATRLIADLHAAPPADGVHAHCSYLAVQLRAVRDPSPLDAADLELFAEESQALLQTCSDALSQLGAGLPSEVEQINEAFRALHTFKGNCGMLGLAQLESMARAAEDALEGLRAKELAPTRALRGTLAEVLGAIADRLHGSTAEWFELQQALTAAVAQARKTEQETRLGELLVARNLVDPSEISAVLALKQHPLGELLVELQAVSPEELEATLVEQRRLRAGEASPARSATGARTTARELVQIESRRLERLQALVELLTSALQASAAERARQHLDLGALIAQTREANTVVDLLPIQQLLRRVRLLPIELAKAQGKRVEVVVHGAELEIGYRASRSLSAALLHLVRNAVDHGIETTAERVASGKPAHGTITIECTSAAGSINIRVSDDGRGLDRERILARAIALGLLPSSAQPTEESVWALIFAPGFSTATSVSDSSGRGVGMDAARAVLELIGGAIRVASTNRNGTTFQLEWPVDATRNLGTPSERAPMSAPGELTSGTYPVGGRKSKAL